MKSKCSFILKSSIALILTALMIFGSVSTVLAATVDMAASGWNNTTWYLGNDIAKVWDNSASNCTMTKSGTVKFYYDLYLKTTDADVYYRPYEKDNYAMGPTAGNNTKVTTTGTAGSGYNDSRCWYFDTADCTASKYNKIRIWIDTSGNNGNGWSWYEKTAISNISPTLTVPSTGTVGTAITLTGGSTDANKIGTLTKTYQYSTDNGSTWKDLASGSYTATSAGTVKFRYKVSDGGVKTSGSGTNGRTARVEYSSEKSCTFSVPTTTYNNIAVAAQGTTDGSTYTTLSGANPTISANSYTTGSSALTITAGSVSGYSFYKWVVTAGSGTIGSDTTASTTFTPSASGTTVTAQYKKSYTISKNTPTGGSVTLSNTSRVAGETFTVTLSASSGYRLKSLTVGGTDVTSSVSSNKYTGTAKGTSNTIAVVASYEAIPATTIYVKKTLASTFSNIHIWSNTSDNWTGAWPGQALSGWSSTTDGKYYYKSFNQDYSTFKFILNNNSSPQTSDSAAYATGKSYYIDSATAGSAAVLTEGEPKASTITYPTGNFTIGGTKPTSAYTGETVSFTVTAADGYRIDKVQYTPAGGTATTITASSGTYSFTMPDKAVTVSVTAVKTYTVTLTAGTGFATKKYKVGSGTQQEYSTAITVDSGSNVVFDVTYTTGYEYDSTSTLDGATASNSNKTFTLSNITTNKTVTLKAKEINYTITYPTTTTGYTLGGNNPTTATYNSNVSFTVTPQTGYRIDEVKYNSTKITGSNNTYSFQMPAGNVTIAVTASKVNSVKAVTNKTSRGTVTVDKDTAAQGDTVKITVTPLAGSLKSLTATYGNGKVYEWKSGDNWQVSTAGQSASAPASALMNMFANPFKSTELAATGAALDEATVAAMPDLVPVGATQTINMVMQEDSTVTINATFDTYSGESTWYYNGYDKDSGNAVSGYHGKQMTESMVSGEKFSYYHVEGRTGTDQTFTVSNGAASSGTRYVYFTASAEGGWSTDENHQYAYFYNTSGDAGNAWPGYKMKKYTTNDYGQNVYRVEIPTGSSPTGVIFNNASNAAHQTTNVTDLSKGGYYLLNTSHWDDTLQKTIHDWQSYDCTYPSAGYSTGTEYFYDSEIYTADFSTKGFYDHNVGSIKFTKPKDLGSDLGDYYINVLYAGKTYTINGVTKTIGSKPLVIWSAEPLAGDDENVTVYAKDGAIRAETFGSTYANIADTKIYAADGTSAVGTKHNGSITNQTYETYKAAKGDTIVIKTQIGATDSSDTGVTGYSNLRSKYYVRGFCVNGEVSELLEWNANGLYTLTFKVPEDTEITKFEITPIYYLRDTEANPIVTYRVTGFTDELKAVGTGKPGWGDTLYTYPFYGKLGGQNNAFGAYPGQPMVYYKGQYQMQIPVKSTAWDPYGESASTVNNTTVSGVTMSNGYWDSVHKSIMGYGDNSSSADHVQTYDYGDFYKIFNEKKPVDNIVFDFKYRTKKHNFENQPAASTTKSTLDTNYGTNGNGFELLTNFHGRNVDLFGTPLSGDQLNATPVYVLSIGGVNETAHTGVENIAGYYATEWMVYGSSDGTNYSRITGGTKNSIPPEVLVLNDDDNISFNNTTYPSADANHTLTQWKELYTALEAYRGKPVMISYEAADAQQGQSMFYAGTGGATRNDGRWLYSKTGENITSKIKIQYSNDNGDTYTDLDTDNPQVTGLSAYFTNTEAYEKMTYSTTIDPDKTFDFEAKTSNANYKFVGWYMADGTKITSDNASHTERSGSYTFVAKFMEVQSGQLIMSHSVDKGTIDNVNYQGAGDVTIAVDVIDPDNGDTIVKSFPATTSDITLDDKIIKSNSNYKIKVTLTSTPQNNNALGTTVLAQPSGQTKFFSGASDYNTTTVNKLRTDTFTFTVKDLFTNTTQDVKSIIYHSYFQQYVFNYDINFEYYDRFDTSNRTSTTAKKIYNVKGTLTNAEAAEYVYKQDVTVGGKTESHRFLRKEFVQTIAPYESNFNEKLTWNFDSELDFGGEASGSSYVYSVHGHYGAIQEDVDTRTAIFALPYEHDAYGAATSDEVAQATTTNLVLSDLKYETVIKANGEYITAPSKVGDKYFQYWSINTTKTENNTQTKGDEVARCYFKSFNFMAYDNYYIEPVYDTAPFDYHNSGTFTNITYLDTTRNQWNTDGENHYTVSGDKKTATATDRAAAADLLYNDFMLNYNYNGKDIYLDGSDVTAVSDLGYIVERVQQLDVKQDGTRDTTMSKYADKGMTAAQAKEIATSYNTNKGTQNKITKYTGTDSRIARYSVNKTALDNKNRIEIYDAYYNAAGWDKNDKDFVAHYAYRNYVYKVYTYMVVDGVTKVSDNPAYFTMYNEAMKTADKMMAN